MNNNYKGKLVWENKLPHCKTLEPLVVNRLITFWQPPRDHWAVFHNTVPKPPSPRIWLNLLVIAITSANEYSCAIFGPPRCSDPCPLRNTIHRIEHEMLDLPKLQFIYANKILLSNWWDETNSTSTQVNSMWTQCPLNKMLLSYTSNI